MGNEASQLAGLQMDEDAVEVTENWLLHGASVSSPHSPHSPHLSVFVSPTQAAARGALPLTQAAKNLMLHRHPCILRYVSSWNNSSRYYLATEEVKPLALVLDHQTTLQVALGLHSVLKALVFLHEKALSSHNNVCRAAIYVSPDGTWKLGGFEYLCRFSELTPSHLQQTRAHRYEKAVPPEEDSAKAASNVMQPTGVDQYAFGVLVEEVLGRSSNEDIPALLDFRDLAKKQLQSPEPSLRPQLAPLLQHRFFSHDFIKVYSFLVELPIKTALEREAFFRSLYSQLATFPEELVATQLGGLLLARVVLLDGTAQHHLLPHLLCPKSDGSGGGSCAGLFSVSAYRQHVVPRLLHMFRVRDAQIRLLLLSHFHAFKHTFSADQLRSLVLPELLVGIKDTNDQLVSVTLHALADLVPLLGAATVIGGRRGRLFTDGRPDGARRDRHPFPSKERRSPGRCAKETSPRAAAAPAPDAVPFLAVLPERPSPDGGEDDASTSDDQEEEETEAWSDWDVPDAISTTPGVCRPLSPSHARLSICHGLPLSQVMVEAEAKPGLQRIPEVSRSTGGTQAVQPLPDISTLDIKNMTSVTNCGDEYDFFQDMEPVISKPRTLHVEGGDGDVGDDGWDAVTNPRNLFEVKAPANNAWEEGDGVDGTEAWGDDLVDWGLDNDDDVSVKSCG